MNHRLEQELIHLRSIVCTEVAQILPLISLGMQAQIDRIENLIRLEETKRELERERYSRRFVNNYVIQN